MTMTSLWRRAFDTFERPLAAASESWVQSKTFMDLAAVAVSQDLLDLRQGPVRLCAAWPASFVPIQAQRAQRHHALGSQQAQHLAEQPAQRLLMPGPEPGDGTPQVRA